MGNAAVKAAIVRDQAAAVNLLYEYGGAHNNKATQGRKNENKVTLGLPVADITIL